ncbi:MAG: arginyltransferase [Hyphomicrobiales bacterium]
MSHHPKDVPQFYLTAPSPCPYLKEKMERKVFTHLIGETAPDINDMLTKGGFRRSQNIAYRPACESCRACMSIRVEVSNFQETKSMRRIVKKNHDLIGTESTPAPSSEQYALFRQYLDTRHKEGGMADMSVLDYSMMVEDSHVNTMVIEYRKRGPDSAITGKGEGDLIAVALTDVLNDGLSMVYSFFDTSIDKRSLGTYMILDHIARARRHGLPYLYLGYWVKGSRKMDYKIRFNPHQILTPNGWEVHTEQTDFV